MLTHKIYLDLKNHRQTQAKQIVLLLSASNCRNKTFALNKQTARNTDPNLQGQGQIY